jgi:hypothetical protein
VSQTRCRIDVFPAFALPIMRTRNLRGRGSDGVRCASIAAADTGSALDMVSPQAIDSPLDTSSVPDRVSLRVTSGPLNTGSLRVTSSPLDTGSVLDTVSLLQGLHSTCPILLVATLLEEGRVVKVLHTRRAVRLPWNYGGTNLHKHQPIGHDSHTFMIEITVPRDSPKVQGDQVPA